MKINQNPQLKQTALPMASIAKREPTQPAMGSAAKLPLELLCEVVRHLPGHFSHLLPGADGAGTDTLKSVRSVSRALAKAVDREHPEYMRCKLEWAARSFVEGSSPVPDAHMVKLLGRASELTLRPHGDLVGSAALSRLQTVVNAAKSLQLLHLSITLDLRPSPQKTWRLDLKHNTSLCKFALFGGSDRDFGYRLQLALFRPGILEELSLGDNMSELSDIYQMLAASPKLRGLALSTSDDDEEVAAYSVDALAQNQQLEEISLGGAWAFNHWRASALLQRLPRLRALDLYGHDGLTPVGKLLAAPHAQLRHLELTGFELSRNYLENLDFAHVPELQELSFASSDFPQTSRWDNASLFSLRPLTRLARLDVSDTNLSVRDLESAGALEAAESGQVKITWV